MNPTIKDIISRLQQEKAALGVKLFNGASEEDINAFEHGTGMRLPEDFKVFYRFSNGFDHDEDMFRMLPLKDILEDFREKRNSEYFAWQHDFHFAEYMIYCDIWTVSIKDPLQNNYTIYNRGEQLMILTVNLAEFLTRLLNGGVYDGLYNWMDEIGKGTK